MLLLDHAWGVDKQVLLAISNPEGGGGGGGGGRMHTGTGLYVHKNICIQDHNNILCYTCFIGIKRAISLIWPHCIGGHNTEVVECGRSQPTQLY